MQFYPTIGLETHIELATQSKMFCGCANDADEKRPNVNICPVCMGHPGTLPVINEEAVHKTIKTGLALNCKVPKSSKFDRKNYFYPDLPKGYQISQYDMPLARNGALEFKVKSEKLKVRINRVHLEEDTGKLIHLSPAQLSKKVGRARGADHSLVDFNRAGIPLMELVTEPDLHSAQEARKFAEELRLILRYLEVSEGDMEKGQMRIEANVSLAKEKGKLGTKVEIKNLNSFRSLEKAIEYEVERQAEILKSGKEVVQETRGWHDTKQITFSQREKEESHDYRYFPEPDLPALNLAEPQFLEKIQAEIPELPAQRRERFKKEYGLADKEIEIFAFYKDLGEFFEQVISELHNWVKEMEMKEKVSDSEFKKLIKLATNYVISDLQGLLSGGSVSNEDFLITAENFAEFVTLIYKGKISSRIAKTVLRAMFEQGGDPSHIIEEQGLGMVSDEAELEKIVKGIIAKNPKPSGDYKAGKVAALQFLVGQAMAASRGKAEPQTLQKLFKKLLS